MMKRALCKVICLVLNGSFVGLTATAQQPLTLRQAVEQALRQNPEAATARADIDDARSGYDLARSGLFPQVSFTEDISEGDDPVYAFGTRLRQQRFTQADFSVASLNNPGPIGNASTRISGGWQLFDSLRTEKQMRGAKLIEKSAASQVVAVDQKIVFGVVAAYQQVLYAEREVDTAQHEVETAEALLKSADDHVKAGLAVESDRMAAEVNLASTKQSLIAAEGDRELAWASLRLAMGAPNFSCDAIGAARSARLSGQQSGAGSGDSSQKPQGSGCGESGGPGAENGSQRSPARVRAPRECLR